MNANSNALDFRDPGTMSEELLSVPGFVNELKDYTLAVSPRPNPPLAFAGALAMLTHLTLFATGIPKFVYGALSAKALENGLLGRCLFVETDEAKSLFRDLRTSIDDISEKLFTSDLRAAAALYCRLFEKARKLAVLHAISENPERPVMTPDAVRWATAFATNGKRSSRSKPPHKAKADSRSLPL